MKKVLIEEYRGFDIEFDTYLELFQCIASDDKTKESKSFAAVKKFVDDYIKENKAFKPFHIESIPGESYSWNSNQKYKVIGVRKDGAFMVEDQDGKKSQLSGYDHKSYMVVEPRNSIVMFEYQTEQDRFSALKKEHRESLELIKAKLKVKTVREKREEMGL